MKISEMNNDQAAEALLRIAEPISRLCDDEDIVTMFSDFSGMKELGIVQAVGRMLPRVVAYALQKHKADLYEIVGALVMMPSEEVAKMNFVHTVNVVRESYDDTLRDFFTQSAKAEKKNGTQLSE